MKKGILALILITCAVFCAFGQNSGPIDLVLLLDTSSAMGSSYEKVNDYITGSFLSEFLRTGDTFHLITFSENPRLDIARRITARGDIETIIGRMLIQYPVETGNNAAAAVSYAESYISTLPPRPKKIVMVSAAGPETSNVINSAKQRFSSKNTTFDFVSVTGAVPGTQNLSNPPGSGRSSPRQSSSQQAQSGTASGATSQGTAGTSTKGTTGTTKSDSSSGGASATSQKGTSGTQTSTQDTATQGTSTQGSAAQGTSQTDAQSTTPSSSQDSSAASSAQETSSKDDKKASDQKQDSQERQDTSAVKSSSKSKSEAKQKESSGFYPSMPMILGIIGALLLLILLIIFASRRLGSSPNRVMASVSASPLGGHEKEDRFADHSKDLASYAARQSKQRVTPYQAMRIKQQTAVQPVAINPTGPLLLNLFVEDQNTSIGKRNIHSLKSGYSLSVGGGKSDDFMIFLVPLPSHLGEIRRSGSQLTFIPRKPKYFPDLGTNEVRDCINKKIRVVSDKNYTMWFNFEMYEDPLIALNRVLHSIKVPG